MGVLPPVALIFSVHPYIVGVALRQGQMKSSPPVGEKTAYPNLTMIVSGIILLYSLLFFPICPSPNLGFAIALELAAFLLIAMPIRTGANSLPLFAWPHKAWAAIESRFELVRSLQNKWRKVTILIAFTLISATLVDLTALWLAVAGFMPLSVTVYSALPVSYLVGNHPALSLEMLTGACVESKQYERAETLYHAVLAVRKNIYGESHPMVAALYADLGDLHRKMQDLDGAESWYQTSMAITEGHGRAVHRLANVLRDKGQLEESADLYKRALALRAKFFGTESTEYLNTVEDYRLLPASYRQQ